MAEPSTTVHNSQAFVRVITTLGHVDHGKTTFSDSLLVANNIISARMAGKIRYLDSREDEQIRGITMESSAVSLRFKLVSSGGQSTDDYVVNLIDTPGHVDFSSEVSTASRLCDGALVLVDVVEGVCTQTIAVLRQAWIDGLRPVLVINKVDRLITELRLAPVEAYHHLSQLIEQVNAVMGSFYASERMEDDLRWREERERRLAQRKERLDQADVPDDEDDALNQFEERDDEDIYFAPDRGNVIFASAIDGWGFRVGKFAQMFAAKLGIQEAKLRKVLWGDFYLEPKTKRVITQKHLRGRNLKPLFVQIVLENIWAVYEYVVINPDPEKVTKIVSTLGLKLPPRDLKSKDTRSLLSAIFSQWLSLSTCTFQAVVDVIPPPSTAQRLRIPKMLYPDLADPAKYSAKNKLEEDLFACHAKPESAIVAYVSKMFAVRTKELPHKKKRALTADEMRAKAKEARENLAKATAPTVPPSDNPSPAAEDATNNPPEPEVKEETLIGFARLYSGIVRIGTPLHCVLPKFDRALGLGNARNAKHVVPVVVEALYVMMGRELVPVDEVQAGNVFAIGGLEGKVWRNATLCAPTESGIGVDNGEEYLVNLAGVNRQAAPIVRVALEPVEPADMPKLVTGLKLLSQADPCVETFQQQTGEHVILTAGELHLERCLKDLRERFAKIEIQASEPIVPFRETAIKAAEMAPPKTHNASRGTIRGSSAHSIVTFTIRAVPLPEAVTTFLQANVSILWRLHRESQSQNGREDTAREGEDEEVENPEGAEGDIVQQPTVRTEDFWPALEKICQETGGREWKDLADHIWTFGPHRVGPNVLVDKRASGSNCLRQRSVQVEKDGNGVDSKALRDYGDAIETGFQIATFQGPLCAEPMLGMAFFLESMESASEKLDSENAMSQMASVTGSLITAAKDACRSGLLDWSPRLMLAMYTCDIQASTDVLGKVYSTVARRRGKIVAEEVKEGTAFFSIRALIPVVESFGFADDVRKRTSGAASPQLIFSGYELLDQDPFWVPTTEEELEDLGEKADRANVARGYMDGVRGRKGMFVEKKLVESASKQRTLKR